MPAAPIPINEAERLRALGALCLLDTPADPAFDRITALAADLFDVPVALVSLLAEHRQWFKSRVGVNVDETPREQAFCGYAILQDEPLVVLDPVNDPRFFDNPMVLGAPGIRFYAGVPLLTQDGHAVGTLCLLDLKPREGFSGKDLRMLTRLGELVAGRLHTVRTAGLVDPVTKLPNRTRCLEVIRSLMQPSGHGAPEKTLAVKIDCGGYTNLAEIAVALGHEHADGFLVEAKERLMQLLPKATTVYRVEHTRFLILLSGADGDRAVELFQKISDAFDQPVVHAGIPCDARATIAAMPLPQHAGAEPAEVLRALMSTLESLQSRGERWGRYEPAIDEKRQRHFKILSSVGTALQAKDQFSLHYQPRIDLSTGTCNGVEALLRWRHPQLGQLSPGEFIPLFEKTAIMEQVTQWVLQESILQAARWQHTGLRLCVSINVSATDLDRKDFVDELCKLLDRTSIDATRLELEFTESALTRDTERLNANLRAVKNLGLHLAIDDFGTGYSNLSYLKGIPARTLKIDQSFIRSVMVDERDQAIVPAIIGLAHALGFLVVAEGIETREILDLVTAWGCDEGQGYFIARPMPVEALYRWLADNRPGREMPRSDPRLFDTPRRVSVPGRDT